MNLPEKLQDFLDGKLTELELKEPLESGAVGIIADK